MELFVDRVTATTREPAPSRTAIDASAIASHVIGRFEGWGG